MHVDLVPQPGIEPGPPALGIWSLSHRTIRRAPVDVLSNLRKLVPYLSFVLPTEVFPSVFVCPQLFMVVFAILVF